MLTRSLKGRATLTDSPDSIDLFVPGRLCLFGEHADWAAQFGRYPGYCMVIGTDQGISATARAAERFTVELEKKDWLRSAAKVPVPVFDCPWDRAALLAAAEDRSQFFRFCAAVAHEMHGMPGVGGGIALRITAMDLPLGKGVSSSAAVCILVARAFDAIYALQMLPSELMDAAYRGERLTGSQCGRMDQACIYGRTPVLLTFRGARAVRVEPVPVGGPIHMFIVDLAGRKDTVRILADLCRAYVTSDSLIDALGPGNERIVRRACGALGRGDAAELGRLMTEAQRLFDRAVAPHSAEQLASPALHALLAMEALGEYVYGGKGVGSQGDGTAQFVARSPAARDAATAAIHAEHPHMRCFALDIPSTRA